VDCQKLGKNSQNWKLWPCWCASSPTCIHSKTNCPTQLAKNNAEQVAKVRRLVEELGYQVATAKEARDILGLKGQDRVKF
jgi:hypothetical protein